MTSARIFIFLILASIVPVALQSQDFQKAFTDFNVANDLTRDQDGNLYTVGYTSFLYEPALDEIVSFDIINKLSDQGDVIWSKDFEINGALTEINRVLSLPNGDIITLYTIDQVGEQIQLGLARISGAGNVIWSQTLEITEVGFEVFNAEVNLLAAEGNNFYVQSKKVNSDQQAHFLTKLNVNGDILWNRSYANNLKINASQITKVDENQLALIGYYTNDDNTNTGMLMLMDTEGQERISSSFEDIEIQGIIADGNDYMVKFKERINSNAGLMRLDNNLNVIWSKSLDFEIEGQFGNFEKIGQDQVVMYVYDNRSRTELLSAFDMNGEIKWGKYIESKYSGRPFTEKVINADGEVLFMSNVWTTDLKSSIFRQLSADGNATECKLPIACINGTDFMVNKGDLEFTTGSPNASINPISIALNNVSTSTANYCEEPANVPSPLFDMDSTACIDLPIFISNTDIDGADEVSWSIVGGPDDAILPLNSLTNNLPLIFSDTGTYTVTQFVDYQGCISSYSQETVITTGLPFSFAESPLILCQDDTVTVNANRPEFVSYLWLDDNSTSPIKKISNSGIYTIELFDGNCTAPYELVVEDFDYGGIEFSLGPDTTVCEFRRFTLAADNISEGVDYIWSDGVGGTGERLANKEGLYTLTVSLDGCDYEDDIFVTFESCEPQIYMPTTFSPNADGINDTFFPQGKNFDLKSFRIYNRWGAMIHDSLEPWDGIFRNQKSSGVYIYNISFLNIRSGDIETKTGSVYMQR